MELIWPILFVVSLLLFFGLTLVGLPGNWLMLGAFILYAALYGGASSALIGWGTVLVVAVLVVVAEVLDFISGAAGIAKGGSKKGALLAAVGGIIGSMMGASAGTVIPVVGNIIGIVLGASLGAMAGAMYGEYLVGKDRNFQWEIGKTAFWARLISSIGKIVVASVVVSIAVFAVLL